jgi:hypothetical protein
VKQKAAKRQNLAADRKERLFDSFSLLVIVIDHSRWSFADFEPLAHFLDLGCLRFER